MWSMDSGNERQNWIFNLVQGVLEMVKMTHTNCRKENRQLPLPRYGENTTSQRDTAMRATLSLAILMTSVAYRWQSEGITNHRRKKNTGHIHRYVSVWVKEDKMCPIQNCFPTLSEAHSLNPVNDYMRYLRYHLQNQLHISAKNHFFPLYNPFLSTLTLPLQSFVERLAL